MAEHSTVVALVVAVIACLWDLWTRRIPNLLTFGAALAAALWFLATGGLAAGAWALCGWCVGLLLFLPFYLLGGMGAGDVKLMAAVGAWLGPVLVFWSGVYGAIAGGVLADLVRHDLLFRSHLVVAAAHEPFDRKHGILGVRDGLPFGDSAHQPLTVLRESNYRRRRTAAFRIGDDRWLPAFHDCHARVGRSKINADNLTHLP